MTDVMYVSYVCADQMDKLYVQRGAGRVLLDRYGDLVYITPRGIIQPKVLPFSTLMWSCVVNCERKVRRMAMAF